jgi:hypothetical protein
MHPAEVSLETVSEVSLRDDSPDDSLARALGGTRFMEHSACSRDVSAYADAPTPESEANAAKVSFPRLLANAFEGGVRPFRRANQPSEVAPMGFSENRVATPSSESSSVAASSASTPPDYDARRFQAALRRGEARILNLKARVIAFGPRAASSGEENESR